MDYAGKKTAKDQVTPHIKEFINSLNEYLKDFLTFSQVRKIMLMTSQSIFFLDSSLPDKTAIQADAEASKIFADYIAFQHEIQIMAQTGQIPDASFQEKMESFGKQIQGNSLLSEFFAKQQQLSIYLSDIEKIVFEPIFRTFKIRNLPHKVRNFLRNF